MLTCIDVKFIFDSVRAGMSISANILQIAGVALQVVFLLFLLCFLAIILPSSSCSSNGGPQLSRQNQKAHGKNKNITAKPNTSQRKQNSFGFAVGICFCRKVFGFCCEVFGFAVRSLVLPSGFWFCHEVFCFCREVFGFAVRFLLLT